MIEYVLVGTLITAGISLVISAMNEGITSTVLAGAALWLGLFAKLIY